MRILKTTGLAVLLRCGATGVWAAVLAWAHAAHAQDVPDPPASTSADTIDLAAIGTSVGFSVTDTWRASALVARFTEIDATYAQIGVSHLGQNQLLYGADYILIDPDTGSEQNTVRGHVTFGKAWRNLRFDLRTALEYRFALNEVSERWRGRVRARATYDTKDSPFRFAAYASLEPNYDFSANTLQQTNYSIGFKPWLTDKTNLDISYIFVDSRTGSDLNLLAMTLNVELD